MSVSLPPLAGIPLSEAIEDLRTLERAINGGVLAARYADGTSITYRSFEEMERTAERLRARILASLNAAGPSPSTPIRAFRITPYSGWR